MLEDVGSAPIPETVRATLGFLEILTLRPAELVPEHLAPLRRAGVTDEGIFEAVYVCCLFNIIDRLSDAFGWEVPDGEKARRAGRKLFEHGYTGGSIPVEPP